MEDVGAGAESGGSIISGGTGRFEGASGEFGYVMSTETAEWFPTVAGAPVFTEGFFVITRTGFLTGKLKY